MRIKRIISLILAVVMCLSLGACGAEKQTVRINYGEEHKVELKNQQEGIAWESSNSDVAIIENGVISGVGPGEATLSAVKDGKNIASVKRVYNYDIIKCSKAQSLSFRQSAALLLCYGTLK